MKNDTYFPIGIIQFGQEMKPERASLVKQDNFGQF